MVKDYKLQASYPKGFKLVKNLQELIFAEISSLGDKEKYTELINYEDKLVFFHLRRKFELDFDLIVVVSKDMDIVDISEFIKISFYTGVPTVKTSAQKTKNYNILGTISKHIIS